MARSKQRAKVPYAYRVDQVYQMLPVKAAPTDGQRYRADLDSTLVEVTTEDGYQAGVRLPGQPVYQPQHALRRAAIAE